MLARPDDSVLDAGPKDSGPKGSGPERFCVVARAVRPAEEMIRFVVDLEGAVVPDVKRNLPSRGLWVSGTRQAVETAVKRKLFGRGFKREVRTGPELVGLTDRLLERAALDALAIAGKAGEVVTGFAKVEAAINGGEIVALLHAADAAGDGSRKLDAALRRRFAGGTGDCPVIRAFSGAELDLALGRPNVVHAAVLAGPASQGFLTRCQRMMRFRTGDTSEPGSDRALGKDAKGTDSE